MGIAMGELRSCVVEKIVKTATTAKSAVTISAISDAVSSDGYTVEQCEPFCRLVFLL